MIWPARILASCGEEAAARHCRRAGCRGNRDGARRAVEGGNRPEGAATPPGARRVEA